MLKESDFRNYFEGKISAESLIEKIQSKEIERNIPEAPNPPMTPTTAKFICENGFHDFQEDFILKKSHLLRLCNDFLEDKISAWDLEDIAFILGACDRIYWSNKSEEGELIAETMFHWSAPEINYPLTKEYIKRVKESLEK